MIDLVIDTCVLVDASQKGDPARAPRAIELLTEFDRNQNLMLAVDSNGFVLYEYNQNLNASMFATAWLKKFADRMRRVPIAPLPRALRVELDQAHFSQPDRRFVQVALVTDIHIIVTRDPDYSVEVQRILRDYGEIRVVEAEDALQLVRAIPCD